MSNQKIMKDLGLNEPVSVTLPAHAWLGFIAAYNASKWSSEDANAIAMEVIRQIFDPVFLKEREAAHSEHHDMHQSLIRHMITGKPPELPPNIDDMLPPAIPGEELPPSADEGDSPSE